MREFDVAVIGAGPGGYVAAIRAAKLGMKTALIEAGRLGGMCLHWGCIPTKALLEAAWRLELARTAPAMGVTGIDPAALGIDWQKAQTRARRITARLAKGVEYLEKKNGVALLSGRGEPLGDGVVRVKGEKAEEIRARAIVLATGSRPDREPLKAAGKRALEIPAFLALKELPAAAAVWGHGPVAVELALLLALLGVSATLVSGEKKLLPRLDGDIGAFAEKRLKKAGVALNLGRALAKEGEGGVVLDDGTFVEAAFVLNASRRLPVTEGLEALDLETGDGGFPAVDEFGRTSAEGVYAAGDLTGRIMLAHAASAQGMTAVNHIAGAAEPFDGDRIPWNIYLFPEIASVGLSEEALKERGVAYDKGVFPLTANSKAVIRGETEGFVKVLADKKYGEVLGVHIVAPDATDMIAEAALAMRLESTALDVGSVVHAHPTLSETLLEASLGTKEMTLHL